MVILSILSSSFRPAIAQADTSSLSGLVTNELGEPLAGIQVDFWRNDPYDPWNPDLWWHLATTFTAADGSYSFYIPTAFEGGYRVFFSDPQGLYAAEYFDNKFLFGEADIIWVANTVRDDINAVLELIAVATGSVTGNVTSEGGATFGTYVTLYQFNGTLWELRGSAFTDGDGNYTIGNLSPANYRAYFWPPLDSGLTPEFFSDWKGDISGATDIPVVAGATTPGIDAFLEPIPPPTGDAQSETGSVTVDPNTGEIVVTMPSGDPSDLTVTTIPSCQVGETVGDVMLVLTDAEGSATSYPMTEDPLVPGQYVVVVPAAELPSFATMTFNYTCNGVPQPEVILGTLILYDPSGFITDANTGQPVVGATVSLFRVPGWRAQTSPEEIGLANTCQSNLSRDLDGDGDPDVPWSQEAPTGLGVFELPIEGNIDPAVNPQQTGGDGHYGWAVPEGCWYVVVQAQGYATLVSPLVGVPTEVTDLDLQLSPPSVQFSTSVYSDDETSGASVVEVTLNAQSISTVTVDYATSDGTATVGSDYTAASGTLTFTPGETKQTFTVPLLDDLLDEADESVVLTLSNPVNATLGSPNPATLFILDDDAPPTVQFSAAEYAVGESDGATTITVNLSSPSGQQVKVDYATSDGTATAGSDYTAASGTLTFAPGETNKTFAVTALDDALVEADETVILTLSNAVNAALGIPNPATLTILDDDTLPTVQFAQAEFFEDEDKDKAVITVTLSRAYDLQVTVDFATSDGTATAGEDYTAASGTLTFAPGEVSQTFEVPLLDDLLDEPFESVNLTLSNPVNATLGAPNPATLYIVDNDGLPTVWFSAFTYEVDEDAGTATITVLLEPDSALEVKVDYATSDGTATAGSDYTASAGTLTFAPGEDSQTFTVPILEDSLQESDETVLLTLSNPLNAVIGLPNPAPLTIVDNDAPPTVQFSSAAYSKSENGGGVATITVNISAISGQQVTVNYSTADGTATAGADYTAASGMLTFAPGQLTQTFEVTILEDELDEADETVSLTLHDPVNATLGSPSQATLNILDNDAPPSVQFSSANFSANEDAGTATISVALSAASGQVVTVDYATSDGTATAGSDYLAASGTLTFAPGVVSQTFTVPLLADTFDELDETVVLTLSEPSNAGLGFPNPATLTIVDTNIPPTVQFEAAIYTVLEGAGTATVTVTLNVASAQQVTVDFATTDESASAGEDYTATSGTLTFASGETSQTFTVAILDDFFVETDETVLLNLANPSNATLGLSSADLTIVNDDIYRVLTAVFIVSVAGK